MTASSGVTGLAGIFPARERFAALARDHAIVPVAVEIVADTLTPVAAFASLVGDGEGFLLESAEGDERWGRYSFVGANVLGTYTRGASGTASAHGALPAPGADEGALAYLERVLATHRTPLIEGLPPLHSGLVGLLAYDVVREVERIDPPLADDLGHPDAAFHLIGELLAFDHWRQRLTVLLNVPVAGLDEADVAREYDRACARLDELVVSLAATPVLAPFELPRRIDLEPVATTQNRSSEDYRSAVAVAKEHIVAGDVFQVVLSQRFDCTLDVAPLAVYRALRVLNPSPYLYLLRFASVTVLGSSPEALVRLRDRVATMRPIAGSRPRGRTDLEDERLAGELAEDPKERAEHVMLVDLGRNDLGRVAAYGTVVVEELMVVERFSHITHLTSQVSGRLADGVTPIDVLRATLPAGTLSGAPKVRAMQLINELEPTRRGVYGGVVGYLDLNGNLDTAIAIRTLVIDGDGRASVQAGAGIVFDSDPSREDEECHAKAAALLAAIDVARRFAP
ncbi:MAG TPA: chorismate-binding protein [Acidimicrobiales bacterium]|nr:chorismate-binding protein [Acidimicrobiales bacterium]